MSTSTQPKTCSEILNAFKDRETLVFIAESKSLETSKKNRKELISELTSFIKSTGLEILLKTLKVATVKRMCRKLDWGDNKSPPNARLLLAKTLATHIKDDPEAFFNKRRSSVRNEICEQLDLAIDPEKVACGKYIVQEAERMGLEHLFSGFSLEKIKEFAKNAGLEVETQSFDAALEALLNLEDFVQPKKEKKQTIKKKPPINKDITEQELLQYLRDELAAWLEEHNVSSIGVKSFLAKKIIATLNNQPLPPPPAKPVRKRSGKSDSEKSEEESSRKRKSSKRSDSDSEKESSPSKKPRSEKHKKAKDEEDEPKTKKKDNLSEEDHKENSVLKEEMKDSDEDKNSTKGK